MDQGPSITSRVSVPARPPPGAKLSTTRTPEGYFHLEIDQVKDDNALYVASELVQVLDMLRLQREAGAGQAGAGFHRVRRSGTGSPKHTHRLGSKHSSPRE